MRCCLVFGFFFFIFGFVFLVSYSEEKYIIENFDKNGERRFHEGKFNETLHLFGAIGLDYLSRKSHLVISDPDKPFNLPQLKALNFFLCKITSPRRRRDTLLRATISLQRCCTVSYEIEGTPKYHDRWHISEARSSLANKSSDDGKKESGSRKTY